MISATDDNSLWEFESFKQFAPYLTDFVTSRHGGYSSGAYATFNCSPFSGDDLRNVERNLEKLYTSLPCRPKQLFRPRQVHGIGLRVIDEEFLTNSAECQQLLLTNIDALVTNLPGYCVCVSTADCIPVLLYDKKHGVVAAIHAGWRGTLKRIVYSTLLQMQTLYGTQGEDIYAGIGPGISLQAFEVGDEVFFAFQQELFDMEHLSFRDEKTGKYHIDLWQANCQQLEYFGIPRQQIELSGICTYTRWKDFFSARRLGKNSGRILSGIMINEE